MKSNPTRAGPSLSGTLHSNSARANRGPGVQPGLTEVVGVRSQGRLARGGGEGARWGESGRSRRRPDWWTMPPSRLKSGEK